MYDLKLDNSGDLEITDTGDVVLTQSVSQAVKIRLRWLFGEWRFAPDAGIPYFERIMVKKPDTVSAKQIFRTEIMNVDGMTDVKNLEVSIDPKSRLATVTFDGTANGEDFSEEVPISV